MIEGPGHILMQLIYKNIDQKLRHCFEAPFIHSVHSSPTSLPATTISPAPSVQHRSAGMEPRCSAM
jgi:hypothetical protein